MDEFWSRKMRRLALLAVINSVAIPVAASEPPDVTGVQAQALIPLPESPEAIAQQPQDAVQQPQQSLRSLLSRGWESGGRYSVSIQPRLAQKRDAVTTEADSGPVKQVPEATVLRPKREPRSVAPPAAEHKQLKPLADNLKSTSLAELLRQVPHPEPQHSQLPTPCRRRLSLARPRLPSWIKSSRSRRDRNPR